MTREIADFIKDILDSIDDIEAFIKGMDFEKRLFYCFAR